MDETSDYINASYLDGFRKTRAYIAALGPTKKTLGEDFHMFWKMVWQERVEAIVMLTKLVEISGMKCDQYWPEQGNELASRDVTVKCVSEEIYAEFIVRNLKMSKKSEHRQLRHVHFTAWPDKGVPSDVISINNLRHKVVTMRKMFNGPLLVHCSAGIGRTGTYIALDILTEMGSAGESVDVFECANSMRQQRVNMVQTLEQYRYLHHAVLWSLTSGIEPIPAERFVDLTWLYTDNTLKGMLKQLQSDIFYDMDGDQEAISANKAVPFSNRYGADIPGARHNVFLLSVNRHGIQTSSYINAVYINGYRKLNRFIAAQTPLPETVTTFLNMILQDNIACIVDLTSSEDGQDIGEYLPEGDQDLQHETFVFRTTIVDNKENYTKREVMISEYGQNVRTVHHFKYHGWTDSSTVPNSPEEFVKLVNDVEKLVITNEINGPIIIHCLTGAVKSGLFCAVWILLERIGTDFRASVLNTLGQIKTRRRTAFQREEHLAFCFECVSIHLKHLDQHVYSNMMLNN